MGKNKKKAGKANSGAKLPISPKELNEKIQSLYNNAYQVHTSAAGKLASFINTYPEHALKAIGAVLHGLDNKVKDESIGSDSKMSKTIKSIQGSACKPIPNVIDDIIKDKDRGLEVLISNLKESVERGHINLFKSAMGSISTLCFEESIKQDEMARAMDELFLCAVENGRSEIVDFLLEGIQIGRKFYKKIDLKPKTIEGALKLAVSKYEDSKEEDYLNTVYVIKDNGGLHDDKVLGCCNAELAKKLKDRDNSRAAAKCKDSSSWMRVKTVEETIKLLNGNIGEALISYCKYGKNLEPVENLIGRGALTQENFEEVLRSSVRGGSEEILHVVIDEVKKKNLIPGSANGLLNVSINIDVEVYKEPKITKILLENGLIDIYKDPIGGKHYYLRFIKDKLQGDASGNKNMLKKFTNINQGMALLSHIDDHLNQGKEEKISPASLRYIAKFEGSVVKEVVGLMSEIPTVTRGWLKMLEWFHRLISRHSLEILKARKVENCRVYAENYDKIYRIIDSFSGEGPKKILALISKDSFGQPKELDVVVEKEGEVLEELSFFEEVLKRKIMRDKNVISMLNSAFKAKTVKEYFENGNEEELRLLRKYGNKDLDECVYFACAMGENELVKYLLEIGASKYKNFGGESKKENCILLAVDMGNLDLAKILIEGIDLKFMGEEILQSIVSSYVEDRGSGLEMITWLIDRGVDPNIAPKEDPSWKLDGAKDSKFKEIEGILLKRRSEHSRGGALSMQLNANCELAKYWAKEGHLPNTLACIKGGRYLEEEIAEICEVAANDNLRIGIWGCLSPDLKSDDVQKMLSAVRGVSEKFKEEEVKKKSLSKSARSCVIELFENHDLDKVKEFLGKCVAGGVNFTKKDYQYLIRLCGIYNGNLEAVSALIRFGDGLVGKGDLDTTKADLLLYSIKRGYLCLAKNMFECHSIHPKYISQELNGKCFLHRILLCKFGTVNEKMEIIELLFNNGADPLATDSNGRNLLKFIKFIKLSAPIDKEYEKFLDLAEKNISLAMRAVQSTAEIRDSGKIDDCGRAQIHCSVLANDCLETLKLADKESLELRDSNGLTAYELAIKHHRIHVARALKAKFPRIVARDSVAKVRAKALDSKKENGLVKAVIEPDTSIKDLESFIIKNNKEGIKQQPEQDYFLDAAICGNEEVMLGLIGGIKNMDGFNIKLGRLWLGNAPEKLCTLNLSPKNLSRFVRIILNRGIDLELEGICRKTILNPNLKNAQGLAIEEFAKRRKIIASNEVVVGCQAKGAVENFTPLSAAAASGKIKDVESLIASGVDIDETKAGGPSPIYAAVRAGHRDVMQLLLKNKANVNVTNRDGENLLRAAFESNEAQRSYMGIIVDLVLHAKKNENVNLMDFVYGANLRLTSQKDLPTENSEEMRLSGELRLKLTLEHVFKNSKSHRKEFFDAMKDSNPIIAGKIAVLWDTLSKKESVRVEELDKSGPAPIPTKPIVEKPPSDNVQGLGASK